MVELSSDWKSHELPPLYLYPMRTPLHKLKKTPPQKNADLCAFYSENQWTTFIFDPDRYQNLDVESLPLYVAGDFNGWSKAIGDKQWRMNASKKVEKTYYQLKVRSNLVYEKKPANFKFVTDDRQWQEVPAEASNSVLVNNMSLNYEIDPIRTGHHLFRFSLPHQMIADTETQVMWAEGDYEEVASISPGIFYQKVNSDSTLGVLIEGEKTVFRLFAPRARQVTVTFYRNPDKSDRQSLNMKKIDGNVWEESYPENLQGYYYYYQAAGDRINPYTHFDSSFKILDPYAIVTTGPAESAIIWEKNKIKKPETVFNPPSWHDLVIVEAHLRDIMHNAPIELEDKDRLGFKGLSKWLQRDDNYFKKLGINAVELQPILEFDGYDPTQYHWGYMPVSFFSPASSYASDPLRGSQIEEFQSLVKTFHAQELAVIIDVVFNHVGEPNHLKYIDKYYYFDLDWNGEFTNWSGTGNTLRCNSPMVRRLIIDSLTHLVEIYDVDGFRFDLAELLGIKTLKEIERELKRIKPSIILIAEPWSFRGHIARPLKNTGYAFWNDGYRDFIKGYLLGQGSQKGIRYYLAGSLDYHANWPAQSVNYLASHDDYCWIDSITENPKHDGHEPTPNDRRRTHLMISILMCSLGIPMLASGQDMLHSKRGHKNTYREGDLNAIDYQRAVVYSETHNYFRQWIHFRLSDRGKLFRLGDRPRPAYFKFFANREFTSVATLYNADFSYDAERILFAINPHMQPVKITSEGLDFSKLLQIADHECIDENGMLKATIEFSGRELIMPPLSCGLWVEHF